MQQVYLWYTVVFQIDSILQRIVTNKRSMLLILNNYVSRNLEVGLIPNNEGTDLIASVSLAGDELKLSNSTSTSGGTTIETVYRRAK